MSPAIAASEPKPGATAVQPGPDPSPFVRVKVAPLPSDSEATAPRVRYWMGTFPECPIWNVTSGGQCFARYTGNPSFGPDGQPDRPLAMGTYNELTASQVEAVKAGVMLRVVRKLGDGRGIILMRDGPHYRAEPGDVPLAKYLFMAATERSEKLPPPMLEE